MTPGFAGSSNPLPLKIEPPARAEIAYDLTREKNGSAIRGHIVGVLDVLSRTDDGFEMSWTTESVKAGGVVVDKSSKAAGTYMIGVPVRFVSDADGLPIKIHNRDSLLESLFANKAFTGDDAATREKMKALFAGMSDDVIAQIFLKAPSYMSICQGTDLEEGVLLEGQGEFPSPWGNGTVLSDISYELSSIDQDSNQATIEYRSSYNPDSLRKLAEQAMPKFPKVEDLTKQLSQVDVARKDAADCVVDTNTGWVQNMVFTTAITAAEKTKSESYEISVRWTE